MTNGFHYTAEGYTMKAKEMFVIGYDSPLLNDSFFFVKRVQGWEVTLDADKKVAVFTR
ncbi:TPA: hypothetical protein ACKP2S_002201 [Serratia marcescens]|uniref:hypothetical protein n=1 Tax=Serratia marcescens TaxID=615 RepID=UPI0038C9618E